MLSSYAETKLLRKRNGKILFFFSVSLFRCGAIVVQPKFINTIFLGLKFIDWAKRICYRHHHTVQCTTCTSTCTIFEYNEEMNICASSLSLSFALEKCLFSVVAYFYCVARYSQNNIEFSVHFFAHNKCSITWLMVRHPYVCAAKLIDNGYHFYGLWIFDRVCSLPVCRMRTRAMTVIPFPQLS